MCKTTAKLCREKQQKVFEHEVKHILKFDFEKHDADKIELDAHSA